MTTKKILSLIAAVFLILATFEAIAAPMTDYEIQEKVINDMARAYSTSANYHYDFPQVEKIVYRGHKDHQNNLVLERSNEQDLANGLRAQNLEFSAERDFLDTRILALAGISAGGILYFFPGQKFFFWETTESATPDTNRSTEIWTNPVIGNIISGVLSRLQRDLKDDSLMMVVLNPADSVIHKVNNFSNSRVFYSATTEVTTKSPFIKDPGYHQFSETPTNYIGLQFHIRF
jgi:hypothetical protein